VNLTPTLLLCARHACRFGSSLKLLHLLSLACVVFETNALAQQPVPGEVPRGTIASTHSSSPFALPSLFALTSNPLSLLIGRYGVSFEYKPAPHHSLVLAPHYDYLSGNPGGDYGYAYTDTLSGGGAELGYRFYSGALGFDGFFAGPSLLIAKHRLATTTQVSNPPEGFVSESIKFTSVGVALDAGWQWQLGHFIIGGGIGVRYAKLNEHLRLTSAGTDLLIDWSAGAGVRPRIAVNLGYAF